MTPILLTGRVLFSALFILAGWHHLRHPALAKAQLSEAGLPLPSLLAPSAALMLLAGGTSVLLGAWGRVGAALLTLFLLSSALGVHAFWRLADPQAADRERVHFLKNLALAGGSLGIVYFGTGPLSLTS
jgi:putative oxidoreductase